MKSLAQQYVIAKANMDKLERRHRVTKDKRREYILLTARALRRSIQKERRAS